MNCIAVIEPKKKIVGIANACTASHLTVKIGYVFSSELAVVIFLDRKKFKFSQGIDQIIN